MPKFVFNNVVTSSTCVMEKKETHLFSFNDINLVLLNLGIYYKAFQKCKL